MPTPTFREIDVERTRWFLEPGPIVLISSAFRGERNVMTHGWHMMLGYSRVGTYIWDANHSFELLRRSRECVINVPTVRDVDTVVAIGNSSGRELDKFETFGLDTLDAKEVGAPRIAACHAHFECRLADASQIKRHGLFIWDVVRAHARPVPKRPRTVHYRGEGEFMVSGEVMSRRGRFKPQNL